MLLGKLHIWEDATWEIETWENALRKLSNNYLWNITYKIVENEDDCKTRVMIFNCLINTKVFFLLSWFCEKTAFYVFLLYFYCLKKSVSKVYFWRASRRFSCFFFCWFLSTLRHEIKIKKLKKHPEIRPMIDIMGCFISFKESLYYKK